MEFTWKWIRRCMTKEKNPSSQGCFPAKANLSPKLDSQAFASFDILHDDSSFWGLYPTPPAKGVFACVDFPYTQHRGYKCETVSPSLKHLPGPTHYGQIGMKKLHTKKYRPRGAWDFLTDIRQMMLPSRTAANCGEAATRTRPCK